MSEANKSARIEYLQSLVGEYRAALEGATDEIKMLRKADINISYKCDTCGEPLCRSCPRCQRGWES